MHPQDVADLIEEELVELHRQLDERDDLQVRELTRPDPTELRIRFAARAHASQLVPAGIVVPGQQGGFRQQTRRVPILGQTSKQDLVLRMRCDNWDGYPPEADLLDTDGVELRNVAWPVDSTGLGIVHNHPDYTRPFFCRPGTREYHSHPVHEDDPWDKHREGLTLAGIAIALLGDLSTRWTMRA